MTAADLSRYTKDEFEEALASIVKTLLVPPEIRPCNEPQAVLLGGQSGAGKTTLHGLLASAAPGGSIIVNGDEYRSRHPHYHELDAAYGPEAVAHTAAWAGQMTEALIDEFSIAGFNLVIEGTLRTSEVPLGTARLLRKQGYGVSLALMAVKPEISLLSCQICYELMRMAGRVPRATDPAYHDKIVAEIVRNVEVLEASGLFDEVRLFSRSGERLYPRERGGAKASRVLHEILFGPWASEEEEHYSFLKARLAELQVQADSP